MLCAAVCAFIVIVPTFASAGQTYAAYKLGKTYKSGDGSFSCLEGHSGQVLGDPSCSGSDPCTQAQCLKDYGANYYCSTKTKRCEYQECAGPSDTSCSETYSHLRSCVKKESNDGGYYCKITCSYEIMHGNAFFSEAWLGRLKTEVMLWKTPSVAASYLAAHNSSFSAFGSSPRLYTCINGKKEECEAGKALCMSCVVASGGTWSVNGNEDERQAGAYPYMITERMKYFSQPLSDDLSHAAYTSGTIIYGCTADSQEGDMTLQDYDNMLNASVFFASIPFEEKGGSHTYTYDVLMSGMRVKNGYGKVNPVTLGESPYCHTYTYGFSHANGAADVYKTTGLADLVYLSQTEGYVWAYDANGAEKRFDVNIAGGSLFCCMQIYRTSPDSPPHAECVRVSP